MGCDATIHLPDDVRVRDAACVIGAALGCKTTLESLDMGEGRPASSRKGGGVWLSNWIRC